MLALSSSTDAFLSLSLSLDFDQLKHIKGERDGGSASLLFFSEALFYARGGVRRARCERIVDNERIPRDALEKFSRRIKKERREYKTKEEEDALHSKSCKWSLFAVKSKDNK